MMEGLASSTRKTYSSAQRKFLDFCQQLGNVDRGGSPCPTDEWTLCLFATYLANSLKHSSIKVYLSAVRSLHIELGFEDPLLNCPRLQRVVRGIKRCQGSSGSQRRPITKEVMHVIHGALNFHLLDHVMFWAACTLAYFGFLRSSEFTTPSLSAFSASLHLTVQDIALDSRVDPSCLRVTIKASKTDPFRKGCFVYIGKGSNPLCAITALNNYLRLRGDGPGPLFIMRDGSPLTRSALTVWIRDIIASAGLEGNFSSHSFRIGAATMAARMGIPDHIIKTLGRWSSAAYQIYIQSSPEKLSSFSKRLA